MAMTGGHVPRFPLESSVGPTLHPEGRNPLCVCVSEIIRQRHNTERFALYRVKHQLSVQHNLERKKKSRKKRSKRGETNATRGRMDVVLLFLNLNLNVGNELIIVKHIVECLRL